MTLSIKDLFQRALRDERKILRPVFFSAETPTPLVPEESYIRLRLARMFLRNRRELFRTQYPVVHALTRLAGLEGVVENNVVIQPELAGDDNVARLDDIVALDQTVLGPLLYRGGDLGLVIGLYAAPADDWAQRFIDLAESVSQLTLNATVTTAISMASTIKQSLESALSGDGLSLKLGLDQELKENVWLAPGYLVMVAAPETDVSAAQLHVDDGELRTQDGSVYTAHDYIVLAIEVTPSRSDWQSLGYGHVWQSLLTTAAEADDIETVKTAYMTFTGAVMSSPDLSWADRSAIVALAQKRVKAIRAARTSADFLDGMKEAAVFLQLGDLIDEEPVLEPTEKRFNSAEALQTDWLS